MKRESPYKELLRLQGLNVFPTRCEIKEYLPFSSWRLCSWMPAVKGNSWQMNLG